MCTFGLSGCRVKHRAAGARTRQPENSKRAHFRVPAFKNTTKIPHKDPKREKEERKLWREEGEKSAKFWAPHPSGPHTSGPHFFWLAFHSRGIHPLRAPPFVVQKFNIQKLAEVEIGRSRLGQTRKKRLAEVEIGRSRSRSVTHVHDLVLKPF